MINRIISTPASKFRHFRRHLGEEQSRHILWRSYQILAPDSDIVAHWNHLFLITCLIALFIDPLYFFLPSVGGPACLSTDVPLGVALTFLRCVADVFFILHVLMKFRTAFVAPSSKIFGRGELVMDAQQIALRYLKSDFIIDLAASLPMPQAFSSYFSFLSFYQKLQYFSDFVTKISTYMIQFLHSSPKQNHFKLCIYSYK